MGARDIDGQAMNEAILDPDASQRRRPPIREPGADSEYAPIVAELRQLRVASQLSRYRGSAPRLPSREAISAGTRSDIRRSIRTLAAALPALELVAKGDVKIVMDQFTPAWKTERPRRMPRTR